MTAPTPMPTLEIPTVATTRPLATVATRGALPSGPAIIRSTGYRAEPHAGRRAPVRTSPPERVRVLPGPALLAHLDDGPGLERHLDRVGPVPWLPLAELVALTDQANTRGRGGAAFPFAAKLRALRGGRRGPVVVNASEGEPASAKDSALLLTAPHRVLDGAAVVARAIGVRDVRVVTSGDRPAVGDAVRAAVAERRASGERIRWRVHTADPAFVAGQARAVLELLAGRPNRPVTSWAPEAVSGHRGRPTLLSNAETFAQVALLARIGPMAAAHLGCQGGEVGTTLLTVSRQDGSDPVVVEVPLGARWTTVLPAEELASLVLLGGFHGTWVPAGALAGTQVGREALADRGWALGAGVVVPLPTGTCPLVASAYLLSYLASQSAGRCGPCTYGLPTLADEVATLASGASRVAVEEVTTLLGLVERRGACAHPDGTARMVRSLLAAAPDEVRAHLIGTCTTPGARRTTEEIRAAGSGGLPAAFGRPVDRRSGAGGRHGW